MVENAGSSLRATIQKNDRKAFIIIGVFSFVVFTAIFIFLIQFLISAFTNSLNTTKDVVVVFNRIEIYIQKLDNLLPWRGCCSLLVFRATALSTVVDILITVLR